jgi:hypothetical protein
MSNFCVIHPEYEYTSPCLLCQQEVAGLRFVNVVAREKCRVYKNHLKALLFTLLIPLFQVPVPTAESAPSLIVPVEIAGETVHDENMWKLAKKYRLQREWLRYISDYSNQFKVDPWLVLAVIRVESYGNPVAVSYANARGLMQIMPGTGRYIAKKLGEPWKGISSLFDPETNIRYGVYYLSELLKWANGDIRRALAAYNGGPGNVKRYGEARYEEYTRMVFKHYRQI